MFAIDLRASERASSRTPAYAFILAVIGVSTLAVVWSPPWLAALTVLVLLIAAPPVLDLRAGKFEPFEIRNAFLIGYFFQFVASTLTSVLAGPRYYVDRAAFESAAPTALLWSSAGLVSFYLGYYWRRGKTAMTNGLTHDWDGRRALAVATSYLILAIVIFAIFLVECGGFYSIITGLNRLNDLLLGKYYFVLLLRNLPLVATLIFFIEARVGGGWRWCAAWSSLAITSVQTAVLGERGPILLNLFAVAFACWYTIGARPGLPRWMAAFLASVALVGIVFVFEAVTILRFSNLRILDVDSPIELFSSPAARNVGVAAAVEAAAERFEGTEVLGIILKRTGRTVSYDEGASLSDAVTMLIPRDIWPEKPYSAGFRVERLFLDSVAGGELASSPSPTLPGELYWNFGWLGIVLGMSFLGFAAARINSYFRERATSSALLIYIGLFFWFLGISDGGIGGELINLLGYLIPAALAVEFVKA